jgi:glycosyltransferase involved in cell wall biosynthesis
MKLNKTVSASVIIATLNRERVLIDTIESVLSLKHLPDEFWVIDQTARHEPEVELYLKSVQKRGVRVVKLPNPGVCFARNLGAALSNSEILIYIDDDVIINDPDYVEKHKRNYFNSKIDAVQGQIIENGIEYFTADNANLTPCGAKTSTFVTANVSIRRSVLLKVGGFDEGFSGRTYANEDGDLGMRLFKEGYRIIVNTEPCLIHLKTSGGGNRIAGRDSFPEWTRSVTFFQFTLRHLVGGNRIRRMAYVFRLISLRRENLLQPWYIPSALLHAFYALNVAVKRHKAGFHSSIINPGTDHLRLEYNPDYVS